MQGLTRLEIIANQTVEKEVRTLLEECGDGHFTLIPQVYGRGAQSPREGNFVWPEINFMAIVWANIQVIELIESELEKLRLTFKGDGIAYFR